MNPVEEKLWNYIDGTCSEQERLEITSLIATDKEYAVKYAELLAVQSALNNMELDEPSMGFTYKVMEDIRTQTAKAPLKAAVNKRLVYGLMGGFALMIVAIIAYGMFLIDWSSSSSGPSIQVPSVHMPGMDTATKSLLLKAGVFINAVLLLFFADSFLRRRFLHHK